LDFTKEWNKSIRKGTLLFSSYQNKKYASILTKWQYSKITGKIILQMTDGAEIQATEQIRGENVKR
jgi:hypothetical protein